MQLRFPLRSRSYLLFSASFSSHSSFITDSLPLRQLGRSGHYRYRPRHQSTIRMTSSEGLKERVTAPYGSWKSPITADVVSGGEKRLDGTAVDCHGRLVRLEYRPTESGRGVLVKEPEKPGEDSVDITPKDFAVRTLAQEYGGGAFAISGDTLIFSNYKDQRLYKQSIDPKGLSPTPLTPDYGGPLVCYADGVYDSHRRRFITVCEDHRESNLKPTTTIVAVSLDGNGMQQPKTLVSGTDFYAFPRIDPKGERLAWIEWTHPNMPWDRSQLWVGYISEKGSFRDVYKRVCVAGDDPILAESATEPNWTSEGVLYFITDRKNGFWNLYKWLEPMNESVALYSMEAEFSRPLWVFGMNSYVFVQSRERNLIACSYRQNGRSFLGILDDVQSSLSLLDIPFTDINNIIIGTSCLYIEGASAVHPLSVAKVTLNEQLKMVGFEIMWSSSAEYSMYESYFSLPELIEFPTRVAGQNAYAYYYPPSNPNYCASQDEKPPLLLKSHEYNSVDMSIVGNAQQLIIGIEAWCRPYLVCWSLVVSPTWPFVVTYSVPFLIVKAKIGFRVTTIVLPKLLLFGLIKLRPIAFALDLNPLDPLCPTLIIWFLSSTIRATSIISNNSLSFTILNFTWIASFNLLRKVPSSTSFERWPCNGTANNPNFSFFYCACLGNREEFFIGASFINFVKGSSNGFLLIVGGPTAETRGILNLAIQYWTSRGWAFVDVNYGGSTGYGREYRERLYGRWGIVDIDDCCSCAKFLVASGKVDGDRLCITGGSAGGYTTLAALAFRDTFSAGSSLYGVADLNLLRAETHKFESHYIDNLVGSEKAYFERSPINFVDRFSCPIILFQGSEDKIVPPDQARKIYKAIKDKGLPVALVEYQGEQHGFRKAENIKFTIEQQMLFFARLVGHFKVADDITPIKVDNFD